MQGSPKPFSVVRGGVGSMGRRRAGDLDVDVKGEGHRLHHHDEEGQAYGQCGEETVVDYRESKLPAVPNQGVALILPEPPFAFQLYAVPSVRERVYRNPRL